MKASEIKRNEFEVLCSILCTFEEITRVFDCSEHTLISFCKKTYNKPFKDVYTMFSARGKASLRRNLHTLSQSNPAVAIFLAKNLLGMRDYTTIDGEIKNTEKSETIIALTNALTKATQEKSEEYSQTDDPLIK
jgi:hypothetical protein